MQRGSPSGETAKEAGRLAAEAGMVSGLKALGVSSVSVFLAQRYWPAFRHGLNVSGKTAIVVSESTAGRWFRLRWVGSVGGIHFIHPTIPSQETILRSFLPSFPLRTLLRVVSETTSK
jgi:hypothetical protein